MSPIWQSRRSQISLRRKSSIELECNFGSVVFYKVHAEERCRIPVNPQMGSLLEGGALLETSGTCVMLLYGLDQMPGGVGAIEAMQNWGGRVK